MSEHDMEIILGRIIQIGIVMEVNNDTHVCRVKFPTTGIISDKLHVLDNRPFIPDYDVPQETEEKGGGSGDASFESHKHDLIIKQWMPKVNDVVVCVFLPIRNSDGFVIGGIK